MNEDDLTDNDYYEIDNQIFLCEICGWWCESSELKEDSDNICEQCNE